MLSYAVCIFNLCLANLLNPQKKNTMTKQIVFNEELDDILQSAPQQIIYLDFDGAKTTYCNRELDLEFGVTVESSGLSQERIDEITAYLNHQYASENILFVSEAPIAEEYSTVFIGNTSDFDEYGSFSGLAETIDSDNRIKNDDAFVLADKTYDNDTIIAIINHELGHIVRGEKHKNSDSHISDYAIGYSLGTISSFYKSEKMQTVDHQNFYTFSVQNTGYYEFSFSADTSYISGIIQFEPGYSLSYTTRDSSISPSNPFLQWGVQQNEIVHLNKNNNVIVLLEANHQYYLYVNISASANFNITYSYTVKMSAYSGSSTSPSTPTTKHSDFTITSSQLSRTTQEDTVRFDPTETIVYTFTVKNAGDLAFAATTADIYIDNKKYGEVVIPGLAPSGTWTVNYSINAYKLGQGSHSIYAKVDSKNICAEYNELNNTCSEKSFIIEPAMADLAIKDLSILNSNGGGILASDREIVFSATIENRSGNKASNPTTAVLYAGNTLIQSFYLQSIAPGATVTLNYTAPAGTLPVGESDFKLILDAENYIDEFNENNNSLIVRKTINAPIKPDLTVSDFKCKNSSGGDSDKIYADKEINLSIVLKNKVNGNLFLGRQSDHAQASLWCNDIKLANFEIPPLLANDEYVINYTIPAGLLPYGSNEFRIVLDTDNQCTEHNEDNNTTVISKTFTLSNGVDLSVSQLKVLDSNGKETTYIKEDCNISFFVTNKGNKTSERTVAIIKLSNHQKYNVVIEPLAPGEGQTYQIPTNFREGFSGNISIDVVIDPTEANFEINRDNNTVSLEKISVKTIAQNGRRAIVSSYVYANQNIEKSVTLSNDYFYIGFDPNLGIDGLKTCVVELYSGDTLIATQSIKNKHDNYTGRWIYYKFSTNSLANGIHTLRIHAYESSEEHTDEYLCIYQWWEFEANVTNGNPNLPEPVPYKKQHDLQITSANIEVQKDIANVQRLTFSIANTGNADSWFVNRYVHLYEGQTLIQSYRLPHIKAGESKTLDLILSKDKLLSVGTHNLTLQIHAPDIVCEYNIFVNIAADESISSISVKQKIIANNIIGVSAEFNDSDGVISKQYSVDLEDWQDYTGSINVDHDCIVHFKMTDSKGNITVSAEEIIATPYEIKYLYSDFSKSQWQKKSNVDICQVKYSNNNFQNSICINTSGSMINIHGTPQGNYQWQVRALDSTQWYAGNNFYVANTNVAAYKFSSSANGNTDLFFAVSKGYWNNCFSAEYQGDCNIEESVSLAGKNRITDVFEGSDDANILVLTDDICGDALFLDDSYSALGDEARLSQIKEIRAGAGDDIIDLTSSQFDFNSDGVIVYGGSGNDIIWANNGSNIIFGDAGDDRIIGGSNDDIIIGGSGFDVLYGGGGNDVFCFCDDWGTDRIEQLVKGSVTLWFENGSIQNWNAQTQTYSDCNNRVTVIGTNNIILQFGSISDAPAGAFDDAASEKIFEDKNKGFIA